jgi:hypothetical protein
MLLNIKSNFKSEINKKFQFTCPGNDSIASNNSSNSFSAFSSNKTFFTFGHSLMKISKAIQKLLSKERKKKREREREREKKRERDREKEKRER